MVRRHARSSFGKAYAFPGGVVEGADRQVHSRCAGLTANAANRLLDVDENGLDFFSAAARELFEESGVLLADRSDLPPGCSAARRDLNSGALGWDEFLDSHDLTIDCANFRYFGFWITPVGMPKRYATRFFLATLPDGQVASHDGGELTDSRWMTPSEVLEAAAAGEMSVHFPTRRTLEDLSRHETLDDMIGWAAAVSEAGVPCVRPSLERRGDSAGIVVPGDGGYPMDDA